MDFLREEVENLKKVGHSWEMEKYQIEEAIMKAIADKNGNIPATVSDEQTQLRPAKRGCCQRCLIVCGMITLAFMFVAVGGAILYNNYTPFEVYINKVFGDLTYPVLRTWRHIVLPLHRYVDVQSYSIAECLINNPWFIPDKNGNIPATVSDEQTQLRPAKRGCYQRCLIVCGMITLAFMFVAVGGAILYNNYTPFEVYINKVFGDLTYPVLRTWRHIVLPLHRYVDVQSYSMAECLINNPWFIPDEPDCISCEDASNIPRVKNVTNFSDEYVAWGNPVIITDIQPYMTKEFTVESFFTYYVDHKDNLDTDLCEVSSEDETVDTIEDYFKSLQKLGLEAPNIRCQQDNMATPAWIAQVTGSSDMELSPIPEGNTKCTSFNVTLNKGEVSK